MQPPCCSLPGPSHCDLATEPFPCPFPSSSPQVRFGVLNAGNYGVPQSRKRTFIWAAAPEEQLPSWPQQRFVFRSPQLTINLPGGVAYTAVPQREVRPGGA